MRGDEEGLGSGSPAFPACGRKAPLKTKGKDMFTQSLLLLSTPPSSPPPLPPSFLFNRHT